MVSLGVGVPSSPACPVPGEGNGTHFKFDEYKIVFGRLENQGKSISSRIQNGRVSVWFGAGGLGIWECRVAVIVWLIQDALDDKSVLRRDPVMCCAFCIFTVRQDSVAGVYFTWKGKSCHRNSEWSSGISVQEDGGCCVEVELLVLAVC